MVGFRKPRVGEHLLNCQSLAGFFCEHASQEIFGGGTELAHALVTIQVEGLCAYASLALSPISIPEGQLGSQKHEHQRTDAPDVATKTVVEALENLWRHIPGRPDLEVSRISGAVKFNGDA